MGSDYGRQAWRKLFAFAFVFAFSLVGTGTKVEAAHAGEFRLRHGSAISPNGFAIYGIDDRFEVFQETDVARRALADSTVALMDREDLAVEGQTYMLKGPSYGPAYNLCSGERFEDQKVVAFCSGALIAPDLILTAGHCMDEKDSCQNTAFVFDFNLKDAQATGDHVPISSVFRCKSIIAQSTLDKGADYAIVRLDHPAQGRHPLKLRRVGEAKVGDRLFVIGHPSGLPAKIALGGNVRESSREMIVANLDTFSGNSGSPVFNLRTNEIEGVLAAGEEDFEYKNSCYASKACTNDGCLGEALTPTGLFLKYVPH